MLQFLGKLFSPTKKKNGEEMEEDAGAEESRIVDSELFIRSDGNPMAFLMSPTGIERQKVIKL